MESTVIVGKAIAGRATSVRKQLLDLTRDVKASTFDMMDLLFEAQEKGYAPQWGFESLADYGDKELGLKVRKVQYLVHIKKICMAVGLTREQYEPAGTSKLREICTLDPDRSFFNKETRTAEPMDENIVRMILDADSMTVTEVKEEVAKLKGQVGPDRRVVRSYSTCQSVWDHVISKAIESARRFLGSKGKDDEGYATEYSEGDCYECICATFLADPNFQKEQIDPSAEKPVERPIIPMEEI